jgi:ABC-type transporter Mla subunit MlaD
MTLETLLSNIRYLLEIADVVSKVEEMKSMIKYDLDGTNNDDLMLALENLENLLDDLEHASNEITDAVDEIESDALLGAYDETDEETDENDDNAEYDALGVRYLK